MTTPVRQQTVTVPAQGGPVDPTLVEPVQTAPAPVIDHLRAHSIRCYWDFRQCCWVCQPQ